MRIGFLRSIIFLFSAISLLTVVNVGFSQVAFAEEESGADTRDTVELETDATDPAAGGCAGDCGLIDKYAEPFLNFLGAIVGLVVTISIVFSGIQYASSGDDPQKVAAAKSRIVNSIIGLVAFLFLYGFLQWLVPGGFL